jgi:hypothetical protein
MKLFATRTHAEGAVIVLVFALLTGVSCWTGQPPAPHWPEKMSFPAR